jgi:hypothetical protein
MKNMFKAFTGILILSLLMVSCKKDKDKDTVTNYFKVNSTTYALAGGTIENYGTDDWYDDYNLDLTLLSSGIIVDEYDDWSGSGKVIYFEMFSTSSTYLPSGVYDYDDVSTVYPSFTFDWSEYCLNWSDAGGNTWPDIISGTVTIIRDGSTYDITLTDSEDISGNTITAHYVGTLEYFDLSPAKSGKIRF